MIECQERALRLITELEEADILKRAKEGRRNSYSINMHPHLRHSLESHCIVGELLTMMEKPAAPSRRGASRPSDSGR